LYDRRRANAVCEGMSNVCFGSRTVATVTRGGKPLRPEHGVVLDRHAMRIGLALQLDLEFYVTRVERFDIA
jgi:hypothetical protein